MNNVGNALLINSKLEKETANLGILNERVIKYHDFTSSMSKILAEFEERLGKLEQNILPVYTKTEHLEKRQQSLDVTVQLLDRVLSHYNASQEVCNLIHMGPFEGNISTFVEALDQLRNAKYYFLNNNSQSVELQNVTSLFNAGCESLTNYYKILLKKYCQPIKPVELLDLIYIEDDSSNEDCHSIKQLPQNTRKDLNVVSLWLEQNLRHEYMSIYSEERCDVVCRSLQYLKDHQKSGSWGNEPFKPRYYGRMEQKKTTSARLQQIFEKKANKVLLRASQTIEQSTGISLKRNVFHSEQLDGDDYVEGDQDMDKYIILLLALQRLLSWERTLLTEIIPPSRHTEVFSMLAQNSIDMIVKDAESITNKVLRSISRKDWSAALGIFSALKQVVLLEPDIDKTCDVTQKQQLNTVLNRLQQTGIKALDQFLEVVKGDSGSTLVGMSTSTLSGYSSVPKDATVHELTSNTIWFIEHLFEHRDVIGDVLQLDPSYTSQFNRILVKKTLSTEEKNRILLGAYFKKVLAELNLTIMNKCEQYNDNATKYLFRLNNIHYILKSLQRTNLLDIVTLAEPDCGQSYVEIIQDLKELYNKSWSKVLANISPLEDLPKPVNGKIKDKERAVIKERFSNFNKDLEDACKVQRGVSVPDVILREGLKRDNVEQIIPKYNKFFELYADVQFSKNPDKYIKFRPQDVNGMLNKLFDDSAV